MLTHEAVRGTRWIRPRRSLLLGHGWDVIFKHKDGGNAYFVIMIIIMIVVITVVITTISFKSLLLLLLLSTYSSVLGRRDTRCEWILMKAYLSNSVHSMSCYTFVEKEIQFISQVNLQERWVKRGWTLDQPAIATCDRWRCSVVRLSSIHVCWR